MPQTINTNLASINAQRNLAASQGSLATSMQRLSSGLRVNSAKDDAAGLAIATRMDAQIRGSNVALRNANDAISMFQTAEGAMGKVTDNLQRIRELAVQSANGAMSDSDRTNLQAEATQLQAEIQRVVDNTKFNSNNLLDGSYFSAGAGVSFQIGANSDDTVTVSAAFDLSSLNTMSAISISTASDAKALIDTIDSDLDTVNSARADSGAYQSRFESAASQLMIYSENMSSAKSRIMDADFATETANLSRAQILQQAGNAMVAQANQLPQQVLKLLQG